MGASPAAPSPIVPILSEDVRPALRLGLVRAEPVAVGEGGPALAREMDAIALELGKEHAGRKPCEIRELGVARELYRSFGVDPTRTRPSSEALLRRVLKGQGLPRISNAVDVCNLCSLSFLLPLGLYDAARLEGQVIVRLGAPGESYEGIRKDEVHLGGRLVIADDAGPFGNPTSDSARTSVNETTRSLWMVIFAPASFPPHRLEASVSWAGAALERHLAPPGGAVGTSGMVV